MVNELLFKVKEWKGVARFQTRRKRRAGVVQRYNLTIVVLETENRPPCFCRWGDILVCCLSHGWATEPRILPRAAGTRTVPLVGD